MSIISTSTVALRVGPDPKVNDLPESVPLPVQSVSLSFADSGFLFLDFIHATTGLEVRFAYERIYRLGWKADHRDKEESNYELLRNHMPMVFQWCRIDNRFGPNLHRAVYDLSHDEVLPEFEEEDLARTVLEKLLEVEPDLYDGLIEHWPTLAERERGRWFLGFEEAAA